jgi:hypothetical protein
LPICFCPQIPFIGRSREEWPVGCPKSKKNFSHNLVVSYEKNGSAIKRALP